MSRALSIFAAADDAPDEVAFIDAGAAVTFAEAARRTAPLCAALLEARPRALALAARADTESLLWLYAAFASGTPVLLLHTRGTTSERERLKRRVDAVETPAAVLGEHGTAVPSVPRIGDEHPLVFIPTSGSTGTPRLVELSRRAVLASAHASAQNLGWRDDDRWLLCLPLAHTGGLSVVVRCLVARRSVVLFEPGAGGLLSEMQRLRDTAHAVTLISLVPTLLERLLDAGFSPTSSLRAVLVGGAGCSPDLARRAVEAGLPLLTSYGLTETASQVVTRRYAERQARLPEYGGAVSSGHPLAGVELRLQSGLIVVRSPTLLSRYVDEAPATDADGWFYTNDRGEVGADGEWYILGRSDDLIVTAGENVDPLEVEAALLSLPGVRAACVVGIPSARYGSIVGALLVASDAGLSDEARLAELLRGRLARHKHPRRVNVVEALPLTASGKVDRRTCVRLLQDPTRAR